MPLTDRLKILTNEFQEKLRAGILEKIKDPMTELSTRMSGLGSITQEITSRLDLGDKVSNNLLKGLGKK